MAEKSLYQKMFVKSGMKMAIIGLPADLKAAMQTVPEGVELLAELQPGLDVLQVFVENESELRKSLSEYKPYLATPNGALWVCYPKGSSGMKTDINRDSIWKISHEYGMDAVSQVAVNDIWSAMRLKIISG